METQSNQACLVVKAASNAQTVRLNFAIELVPDSRVGDVRRLGQEGILRLIRDVVDEATAVALASPADVWGDADLEPRPRVAFDSSVPAPVVFASRALNTCSRALQQLVPPDLDTMKIIDEELGKMPRQLATIVAKSPAKLDLTESALRSRSTDFGILISEIVRGRFADSQHQADVAFLPGGTFRLDRHIEQGEAITQRVLCDVFYYESEVLQATVSGALIANVVQLSQEKARTGEFLQISGMSVSPDGNSMLMTGQRLDMKKQYRIAIIDYMTTEKSSYFKLLGGLGSSAKPLGNLRARVSTYLQQALDALASDPSIAKQGWLLGPQPQGSSGGRSPEATPTAQP